MEKINISQIKPNEHNPRDITPEKFDKLVKSIQEFPEMLEARPLVIDENNVVLGGNMRLRALQKAGVVEIPVKQVKGWTEEQKKEFIIKDNIGYGEWDWELLANSWDAEQLEEWGLEVPDWETKELEAKEDNYQVPDEIETDIQLGDLFQIGEHRLMCGNSTDSDQVAKLMNGEKVNCVITDPPYNLLDHKIETGIDTDNLFNLLYTILPDNSFCSFFGQHPTIFDFLTSAYKNKFQYKNEIIWSKLLPSNIYQDLLRTHENLFILQKGKLNFYSFDIPFEEWMEENYIIKAESIKRELSFCRSKAKGKPQKNIVSSDKKVDDYYDYMGTEHQNLGVDKKRIQSVWHIYRDSFAKKEKGNSLHITQKPIEFLSRLVKMTSQNKQIILDLFLGSGSTMVASHQLKRKCYGMELDPKYCQVIIDRMRKLDPNLVIKKNGETVK